MGRQLHFWWLAHLSGESPSAFHAANLVLFLCAVALLFAFTRRLAGRQVAAVASSFVALHYAADVPLRWASGSQDLLALVGALGALLWFVSGRRVLAALALVLALLSKETVLFTPLIAAAAARRPGEPWRATAWRAWPLAAAVAAWVGFIMALGGLHGVSGASSPGLSIIPAALAHLAQVSIGLEWG